MKAHKKHVKITQSRASECIKFNENTATDSTQVIFENLELGIGLMGCLYILNSVLNLLNLLNLLNSKMKLNLILKIG